MPRSIAIEGSAGVEGVLCRNALPSLSRIITRSVNVPPTSMPSAKPFMLPCMLSAAQRGRLLLIDSECTAGLHDADSIGLACSGKRNLSGDYIGEHAGRIARERI